jgi:hypothetical protein
LNMTVPIEGCGSWGFWKGFHRDALQVGVLVRLVFPKSETRIEVGACGSVGGGVAGKGGSRWVLPRRSHWSRATGRAPRARRVRAASEQQRTRSDRACGLWFVTHSCGSRVGGRAEDQCGKGQSRLIKVAGSGLRPNRPPPPLFHEHSRGDRPQECGRSVGRFNGPESSVIKAGKGGSRLIQVNQSGMKEVGKEAARDFFGGSEWFPGAPSGGRLYAFSAYDSERGGNHYIPIGVSSGQKRLPGRNGGCYRWPRTSHAVLS